MLPLSRICNFLVQALMLDFSFNPLYYITNETWLDSISNFGQIHHFLSVTNAMQQTHV